MQDNKSLMRFKSGGSMFEAITTLKKATGGKTGEFSEERCIRYSVGNKTLVSLNITEEGFAGRVYIVYIDLFEDSGKGCSAYLNLRLMRSGNGKGILCNYMNTKFVGSYDSCKENYCVPPLPDRDVVRYFCRETGLAGCFTLEKKKDDNDVVERVKATYDFVIGELTWHVKIRIRNEKINGLKVEVEGPVKLTSDYMEHVISRKEVKTKSEIEASKVSLMRSAARQSLSVGHNEENHRNKNGGQLTTQGVNEGDRQILQECITSWEDKRGQERVISNFNK